VIDTEDQGAEAALLGAVLLARGAMDHALARVSAADFVRREHAAVYAACSRLISRGAPCEVRTVRSELAEMRAELPDAGALLLSLVDASADKRNAEHYAARVLELGMRRRLAEVSG
jgi:replicative DNA helicase